MYDSLLEKITIQETLEEGGKSNLILFIIHSVPFLPTYISFLRRKDIAEKILPLQELLQGN